MQINKAQFVCSSERLSQLPKDSLPEFAFIGRSNVGKSSLVNMLCVKSGLAKVSGTPGKTRRQSFPCINDSVETRSIRLATATPAHETQRDEFAKIITDYVLRCERMHFLFVLVDSRLEPQKIDLRFIEMLGREGIPFGIVFTKTDKLSAAQLARSVERYKQVLGEQWRGCLRCSAPRAKNGRAAKRSWTSSANV